MTSPRASTGSGWLPLAAVLLLGSGLRILWVTLAARIPEGGYDPARYLIHALQLAQGDGYVRAEDGLPTAYYPVGYPLVLSLAVRSVSPFLASTPAPAADLMAAAWQGNLAEHADALGTLVAAGVVLNVVLGVATIALAYAIARALAGRRAALLAALGVACFPNLVFHTAALLTETLFIALLTAALATLLAVEWKGGEPRAGRLLIFGALVGCAALVRPIALVLLAILPIPLVTARIGGRRVILATAVTSLAAAAVIAPWTARNIRSMRAPILISTNSGDNLCIGHHRNAPGHFVLLERCHGGPPYGVELVNPEWEVRRNERLSDRALQFVRENPGEEARLLGRKLYYLVSHDHNGVEAVESYGMDPFIPDRLRAGLEHVADAYFFIVLGFGALGLVGTFRRPFDPRRVALALAALGVLFAPLLFFGHPRFHVPASPLLVIAAAVAVAPAAPRLRRSRSPA